MIILHLYYQQKKISIKILYALITSSLILIASLLIFLKFNDVEIKNFFTQYFYYPSTIGEKRYGSIKYDFKNIFLNFKFIFFFLFFLFFFIFIYFY